MLDIEKTIATQGNTLQMPSTSPRPHLVVLYPQASFKQIPLTQGITIIGRGLDADIRLDDDMISRKHCEIFWDGNKVTIRDLDSTNGTFIDGIALTKKPKSIDSENRLQIGKMVLKIDFKDPSEEAFDKALFEAATTDPLTRISNRRTFMDRSLGALANSRRKDMYAHIIMCDIDHFKKVNDTWGHQAGDMILKGVAQLLSQGKRESDLFARYGGEEFVFLLTEITKADAVKSAERLRVAIEKHAFSFNDKSIPVTLSLGVASHKGKDIPTIEALISEADKNLYFAKDHGRNQVASEKTLKK
ncbi:MAG: GGDEF domain-containing protein [Fibrobacteraceae bacterium]|nr:GGDEF domain-containing protein [Fibrobacteraceae bacterium]